MTIAGSTPSFAASASRTAVGAMVGVTIDTVGGIGDRGQDRIEGRCRILVRRELDRIGDAVLGLGLRGSLAGSVRREVGDDGSRPSDLLAAHDGDRSA